MVFHTSSDDETASALTLHAQPDSSIAMQSRITVIFFIFFPSYNDFSYGSMILKYRSKAAILSQNAWNSVLSPFSTVMSLSIFS